MTATETRGRHGATDTLNAEPEEFHFMLWGFDITAVRELLSQDTTPRETIELKVANYSRMLSSDPETTPEGQLTFPLVGVDVEWERVDGLPTIALKSPVYVAPMGELGDLIIDGWHRLALGRRHEIETLPAIVLTREETARILLRGSAELPPERKES